MKETINAELAIVGGGMAGLTAALFAAQRGVSTVLVGGPCELVYAAGVWDLVAVHPVSEGKLWSDPWAGLAALVRDIPQHPFARISVQDVSAAFDELLAAVEAAGLPYCRDPRANVDVVTCVGTRKRTYCIPASMWAGVAALRDKAPCLLVDFTGTKDYSAKQIREALEASWPELRTVRLTFPGTQGLAEVTWDVLARMLDDRSARVALIELLRPHLRDERAIGLPAMLGLERCGQVIAELREALGVPVFEIPTPPVSVPGLRLLQALVRLLEQKGCRLMMSRRVTHAASQADGSFLLEVRGAELEHRVHAKAVVLATGRFLGGGLAADRSGIRETLFDLPVHQPAGRHDWHSRDLFDRHSHAIHQAGLQTDNQLRPLDAYGGPALGRLFAAGSVLAHQDWTRTKSGTGLAVATAYAAVKAYLELGRGA
ncbi:MAG: glycerol-3-phosphate dehydrogenase subunit GlpB [Polyangiaceae bacterium]|jgi:glycerol-3-phosphate dehydrogenase subunit B|nr:glycerol-3-phosphate dehydrogenase subunit GlpB [Polyangiaceae bacterium]